MEVVRLKLNFNLLSSVSLGNLNSKIVKSVEKLSSRLSATCELSGEKAHLDLLKTDHVLRDVQDGVTFLQTAEQALAGTLQTLGKLRELTWNAFGTTSDGSVHPETALEIEGLMRRVEAVTQGARFHGTALFGDDASRALWTRIAEKIEHASIALRETNDPAAKLLAETFSIYIEKPERQRSAQDMAVVSMPPNPGGLNLDTLGLSNVDLHSRESAARSLSQVDRAIGEIASYRGVAGAQLARLEDIVETLTVGVVNRASVNSKITNSDLAKDVLNTTKYHILLKPRLSLQANNRIHHKTVLGLSR